MTLTAVPSAGSHADSHVGDTTSVLCAHLYSPFADLWQHSTPELIYIHLNLSVPIVCREEEANSSAVAKEAMLVAGGNLNLMSTTILLMPE